MPAKPHLVRTVAQRASTETAPGIAVKPAPPAGPAGPEIATLSGVDDEGRALLALPDRPRPVPARVGSHVDAEKVRGAIAARAEVIVAFAGGDRDRPVIIGLVEDRPAPAAPALDAMVDGRRVKIVAEDEIVLECGKASITLRRNGRVVVKGTHVQTDSEGVNLVRGAQVRIN